MKSNLLYQDTIPFEYKDNKIHVSNKFKIDMKGVYMKQEEFYMKQGVLDDGSNAVLYMKQGVLDGANVVFYVYKNKEWIVTKESFPAGMSFPDLRAYYKCSTDLNDEDGEHRDFPYMFDVYTQDFSNLSKDSPYLYAVEIDFFYDHSILIFCEAFHDLMQLFNELQGYNALLQTQAIYKTLSRTVGILKNLEIVSKNLLGALRSR